MGWGRYPSAQGRSAGPQSSDTGVRLPPFSCGGEKKNTMPAVLQRLQWTLRPFPRSESDSRNIKNSFILCIDKLSGIIHIVAQLWFALAHPPSDERLPFIVFLLPEGLLRDAWPLLQSQQCSPLVGREHPL